MSMVEHNVTQEISLDSLYQKKKTLEEDVKSFKKLLEEYKTTCDLLEELPKKLNHPVMVPLGSQAFVSANLINTNQNFMHLGNRIFAKRLNIHTRSSLLSRTNETQNIMQLCLKQLEAVNIEIETLTSPETQNNSKGFIRKTTDGFLEIVEPLQDTEDNLPTPSSQSTVLTKKSSLAVQPLVIERTTVPLNDCPVNPKPARVSRFLQERQGNV